MHDFGKIAYLDLHKSGSTFVSRFLRSCCTLEEVDFRKHDGVREDYNPACFYFISIRNPFGLYSSLYRYGLERKGGVFQRLRHQNLLNCYESFNSFTRLLLDEDAAASIDPRYTTEIAQQIGFMSFRLMVLNLQYPMRQIGNALRNGQPIRSLEKNFITSLELKSEELANDLRTLSTDIRPQYFDREQVTRFLDENTRINASSVPEESIDALTDDLKQIVSMKEELLMSRYSREQSPWTSGQNRSGYSSFWTWLMASLRR